MFADVVHYFRARLGLIAAALVALLVLSLPSPASVEFGENLIPLTGEGQKMLALLGFIVVIFIT